MTELDPPSKTVVQPSKPFFAMLEMTAKCNSRCIYCSCWQSSGHLASLSAAQCRELIPGLQTLGVRRLILTGGEPLLNSDLPQIIRTSYQNRIHTSVVTNGIALTRRRYENLVHSGLLGLTLSLDTLDESIYRVLRGVPIDFAMRAVQLLEKGAVEYDISVSINCVMTALNYRQVPDLVRFANQKGIPVMIQPCNTDRNPKLSHLVPRP
jgi:MoaA/NifB/PqqE/SkfB family radical SAM enzyme